MKFFNIIYKMLTKNLIIKMMAMFLTTIIWLIILSSKQVQSKKIININYITPTGYTVSDAPKEITIKLKGPKAFIDEIMLKEKYINVDLRNKKTGFVSYKLSKNMITVPISVEIIDISPKEIVPKLEKLASKELSIEASLVGNLKDTYELKSIKITPKTLKITGPKNYIDQIKKLETTPIDISKLKEAISLETKIDSKYIKNLPTLKDKKISVYLDISPIITTKIYRNIPVIVKGINNRRYKINPKMVDIVAKGPQIILDSLEDIDIKASIDITFNKKGSYKEDINIEVPENLSITSINPRQISVWIY